MSYLNNYVSVILTTLIALSISEAQIIHVMEGNEAILNFPYPCNSTKVTLRHGYKVPFYTSTNPEVASLAHNQILVNQNGSKNDSCSIRLTIDPVSRDDQGTYILTAYKDGIMVPEYPRIGLRVDYPPGVARCDSTTGYIDQEWTTLECMAPAGTLSGWIVCYQNGSRVPPLTMPTVRTGQLHQSLLVGLTAGSAICCSSLAEYIPDRCECMDCGWDPVLDETLADIEVPCPEATPTPTLTPATVPNHTSIYSDTKEIETPVPTSDLIFTEPKEACHNLYPKMWSHIVFDILIIINIIFSVLIFCRIRYIQIYSRKKEYEQNGNMIRFLSKDKIENINNEYCRV